MQPITSPTPGPWEIHKNNHNLYIGHKEPSRFAIGGFTWQFVGRPVPEQKGGAKRGCSPSWYGWSPQIEANARLIAAAPDLLEVVQLYLEISPDQPPNLSAKARAAIAKAEGRQ